MAIQKIAGTISQIIDLSPTAKEITLKLDKPLTFISGCFVNLFIEDEGEKFRRAFSISSVDGTHDTFTLSIRESLKGRVSPLFWKKDMLNTPIEIMGPLGLNTADKMHSKRIFLFGFGIGVGVIKSLAEHFTTKTDIESITIFTGSRNNADVMYKDFFTTLTEKDNRVSVKYIVTENDGSTDYSVGFIQNHINDLDFNNSDIYICGQEVACNALQEKAKESNPENCTFSVEAFH